MAGGGTRRARLAADIPRRVQPCTDGQAEPLGLTLIEEIERGYTLEPAETLEGPTDFIGITEIDGSAGPGAVVYHEGISSQAKFPRRWLSERGLTARSCRVIRVKTGADARGGRPGSPVAGKGVSVAVAEGTPAEHRPGRRAVQGARHWDDGREAAGR